MHLTLLAGGLNRGFPHGRGVMRYQDQYPPHFGVSRIYTGVSPRGMHHSITLAACHRDIDTRIIWAVDIITSVTDTPAGTFRHGLKHGTGATLYADGAHFTGTYCRDIPQGAGKHVLRDGGVIEGTFVNGRLEGRGVQTLPTGAR